MRTEAKVTNGLAVGARTTDQKSVLTLGGTASELIKSKDLTASLEDAGTGTLGDTESSDRDLGDLEQANIVGDGANNDDGLLVSTGLSSGLLKGAQADRGAVSLGEEEALENDPVETGVGAASEEAIELHKQSQVGVLASGGSTLRLANVLLLVMSFSHTREVYCS